MKTAKVSALSLLEQTRTALAERRVTAAVAAFDQVERDGAPKDECAAGRWQCWMLLEEFERAWQESDRIRSTGMPEPHGFWDGEPLDGRRVILRCLHGFGDAIQFGRYIPMIRERARSLVVEVAPKLLPLFSEAGLPCEVITWGEGAPAEAPAWDQQIEVMELPYLFRTTAETIPRTDGYLQVSSARLERARALVPSEKELRIGLLCTASKWDAARSMPAEYLLPAIRGLECRFFGLNCESNCEEAQVFGTEARYTPLPETMRPIADTAAWAAQMDLVITVDTMTAHLAATLGRPVWLLLPYQADWRWGLDRDDSLWYPTMRVFRQREPGNWQSVADAVAKVSSFSATKTQTEPKECLRTRLR